MGEPVGNRREDLLPPSPRGLQPGRETTRAAVPARSLEGRGAATNRRSRNSGRRANWLGGWRQGRVYCVGCGLGGIGTVGNGRHARFESSTERITAWHGGKMDIIDNNGKIRQTIRCEWK